MPTNGSGTIKGVDNRLHCGCCSFGNIFLLCILDCLERYRFLELESDCWLGLGYYQLRLVGRYWSRRNFDFGNFALIPSKMADRGKPCSRSDDDFRCNLCGSVSDYSHGTCLDGDFHFSLSKYTRSSLA